MSKEKEVLVFEDVKSFTVDRDTWWRGRGEMGSCLFSDGKFCCMGFYSLACGFTKKMIKDRTTPESLVWRNKYIWKSKLIKKEKSEYSNDDDHMVDSKECVKLMGINDNANIDDATREAKLKKLFAKIGIKVKFINGKKK